jgi:hypothetical protein
MLFVLFMWRTKISLFAAQLSRHPRGEVVDTRGVRGRLDCIPAAIPCRVQTRVWGHAGSHSWNKVIMGALENWTTCDGFVTMTSR